MAPCMRRKSLLIVRLDRVMQQDTQIRHIPPAGAGGRYKMPAYKFETILREGMKLKARKNRESTQKKDGYNAIPLLRFFSGYWVTYDPTCRKRKILTPESVGKYVDFRLNEDIASATIKQEVGLAQTCINVCIKKKYWELPNPFNHADVEPPKPRKRTATSEEISAMLLAAEQPLKDMILLWLNTWMRPSELRCLRRDEDYGDRIVLTQQKNGTNLPLAINQQSREILDRQPNGEFFFQKDGEPLTKDGLAWLWKKARRKACMACPSVSDLQVRDLRRTGATAALAQPGTHVGDIQAQLRHKSLRMTESVYTRPDVERARAAVEARPWSVV